jgi:hypothetical protein
MLCVTSSLAIASGCSEKSAEKCSHGLSTAHQALEVNNVGSAKEWRDYALKYCDSAEPIANLDAEIAAKSEASAPTPQQPNAERMTLEPGAFIRWIVDRGGKLPPTENETCYGPGDAEPGWCTAAAAESGDDNQHVTVVWFKDDPSSLQFSTSSAFQGEAELRCESLGATTIRRWQWNKSLKGNPLVFSHCRMDQGPLRDEGWHLLIKKVDAGSWILVTSQGYLKRHKNTLRDWETLGTTL